MKPASETTKSTPESSFSWKLFSKKVCAFLPKSDFPAAKQPTPLQANRYLILLAYCLQSFLTGCVYFGWAALASVFIRIGAFRHTCVGDFGDFGNETEGNGQVLGTFSSLADLAFGSVRSGTPLCDQQDVEVQKLYTITFAVHCTASAFAGTLLDYCGPRVTCIIGQLFNMTAWLLVAAISAVSANLVKADSENSVNAANLLNAATSSDLMVYASCVCIGIGADFGFLPTLNVSRLFPDSSALTMGLLGSAVSASFAIPAILEALINSYPDSASVVLWVFAACAPGMSLLIAVFLMPWRSFYTCEHDVCMPGQGLEMKAKMGQGGDQHGEEIGENGENQNERDLETCTPGQDSRRTVTPEVCCQNLELNVSCPEVANQVVTSSSISNIHQGMNVDTNMGVSNGNCPDASRYSVQNKLKTAFAVISKDLFSIEYAVICMYFMGVGWASAFYQLIQGRIFSKAVLDFIKICLPLSFLPCIVLGKVSDVVGIMPVICFINSSGLIAALFSFWAYIDACGYLSILAFTVYLSFFTSQVFVYIERTFSTLNFGKLAGIIQLIGGLTSLLCNPIYESAVSTVDSSNIDSNLQNIQIAAICILVFQYVWVCTLFFLKKRRKSAALALKDAGHDAV